MSFLLPDNYATPPRSKNNERKVDPPLTNLYSDIQEVAPKRHRTGEQAKVKELAQITGQDSFQLAQKLLSSFQVSPKYQTQQTAQDPAPGAGDTSRPGYDDYGKELGKDARVWKTYVQEASRWDSDLVDGWHRSLDLILSTAALFSAISTASFVIESVGDLKPDYAEVSARTLYAISQTLLPSTNGQPNSTASVDIPDPDGFSAPMSAICVNALWFLSLSLSVAVSLIAMLAKDWARSYVAELTGQPYQQARKRQRRWDGLREWKVPEVIQFLPSILHLSLLLFAIGLTVYLWNVHIGAAIPVLVVTVTAVIVYVVSTILPLRDEHCPYSTPLSKLIAMMPKPSFSHWFKTRTSASPDYESVALTEVSYQEKDEDLLDDLTSRALAWLIINYEDTKSVDIALQAIAGSETRLPMEPLVGCGAFMLLEQRLQTCFTMRQKTGKLYLKDNNLLEAALLYGRALTIPGEYLPERTNLLGLVWPFSHFRTERSIEQSLIDYIDPSSSFTPNKIAFALATLAVGSKPVHDKTGTRLIKPLESVYLVLTTRLLQLHMDDEITLEPPALLALLRAAAYWPSFDRSDGDIHNYIDLMITLSRFLSTLDRNGSTFMHALVGTAMMTFACSQRDYSHWPHTMLLPRLNNTARRAVVAGLYDLYRDTAVKDGASLITFGVLELLKHHAEYLDIPQLKSIIGMLCHYKPRAPIIETYDLPKAVFGSDFKYIIDSVVPFIKADQEGGYACNEALRAVYMAVPNAPFMMDCPEAAAFYNLALENLRTAESDLLKQRCCSLLTLKSVLRSHNLALGTTNPYSLLLAISMLDSEDERVTLYAMRAIWNITDTVLIYSKAPQADKIAILQPVLDHKELSRVRPVKGVPLPEFTGDMGYIEAWLPRLEDIGKRIPQYIQDSEIAHSFRTRMEGQNPPHPLWDRLIALLEHCRKTSEAMPPPWS
ncbi:transmembrane protein [Ceratobasidium sp. AG-Ba]|nr:transmembrane protein [Ceratobasidium sp. AG-Ba]